MNRLKALFKHYAAPNSLFSNLFQFLAIATTIVAIFSYGLTWWWLVAFLFYFLYYGVGVSMGNHRWLTHEQFETYKPIEYLMLFLATVGHYFSPSGYAVIHDLHHRRADREGDPHNPREKGFWRLTFWTYFMNDDIKGGRIRKYFNTKERIFFHRYNTLVKIGWIALLLLISIEAFVFMWAVPFFATQLVSSFAVTLLHMVGYRNHDTKDESRNNIPICYINFGEWHNNHHANPKAIHMGEKWWEIDPTAWLIYLIRKRG